MRKQLPLLTVVLALSSCGRDVPQPGPSLTPRVVSGSSLKDALSGSRALFAGRIRSTALVGGLIKHRHANDILELQLKKIEASVDHVFSGSLRDKSSLTFFYYEDVRPQAYHGVSLARLRPNDKGVFSVMALPNGHWRMVEDVYESHIPLHVERLDRADGDKVSRPLELRLADYLLVEVEAEEFDSSILRSHFRSALSILDSAHAVRYLRPFLRSSKVDVSATACLLYSSILPETECLRKLLRSTGLDEGDRGQAETLLAANRVYVANLRKNLVPQPAEWFFVKTEARGRAEALHELLLLSQASDATIRESSLVVLRAEAPQMLTAMLSGH